MARQNTDKGFPTSPGKLYKSIDTNSELFSEENDSQLKLKKDPAFVIYCKKMARKFPSFTKGAKFSKQHEQAVAFLGWRLNAGEFMAAIKGSFVTYLIPIILILALIYILGIGLEIGGFSTINLTSNIIGQPFLIELAGDSQNAFMFFGMIALVLFGVLGMGVYMVYSYPINAANSEKNRALTYVPEMIGYMIMSMKLVPNLEKAIEFSAKHGKGRIATEFKRLLWDFQIGVYGSVAEGLDNLAYRWAEYSSELKESLMKIRASVMEPSEAQRYELLDKTMLEVLESVKEKMEDYARSLNQPAVMLFYLGVLLPLILIIILPVGSAFSGSPLANPLVLIIVYCIAIPVGAFMFAKKVIDSRPPTYEPPEIKDSFSELPKKWSMKLGGGWIDARMVAIIILIFGILLAAGLSTQGFPPKIILQGEEMQELQIIPPDKDLGAILEERGDSPTLLGKKYLDLYFVDFYDLKEGDMFKKLYEDEGMDDDLAYKTVLTEYLKITNNPRTDPTKNLFWSVLIIFITLTASFLLYQRNIYKRKAQLKVIKMEDEFKESMYVIASRMGENKPVETALKKAKEFLPNLSISQRIFGKTIENIELMGLPLDAAVFDPMYGSLRGIPSKTLKTAMKLLVDSVNLGVEVASRTVMSLSLQLENMDKVNKSLKNLVSDVSTTMTTMAMFIAPVVLGITVALQKVVMMTLGDLVTDPALAAAKEAELGVGGLIGGGGFEINELFSVSVESFQSLATPLMFLIIISIYVIEIVIIMIYFTTKIQEDNELLFRITLAKSLPIAVIVFIVSAFAANMFIAMMM
jgi:hypothetical protein